MSSEDRFVQVGDLVISRKQRKRDKLVQWLRSGACLSRPPAALLDSKPTAPTAVKNSLPRNPTRHSASLGSDPLARLCIHGDPRKLYPQQLVKIGQGRHGAVFRLSSDACAKEIKVPIRPAAKARIHLELRALSELAGCRNVLNLKTAYMWESGADRKVWVVTTVADEGPLAAVVTRMRLNEAQMSVVLRQLLMALEFVHARGWIHRDVKSDNLFIAADGRVILGDFGAACPIGEGNNGNSSLGTPHWMAPECAGGRGEWSAEADVWAAGMVLHEMIVGEPLFWHLSQAEAVAQIVRFTKLDVSSIRGSDVLKDLLCGLLAVREERMSVENALNHPFVTMYETQSESILLSAIEKMKRL